MKHNNLSPLFKQILLFLDREKEPKAPTTERKSVIENSTTSQKTSKGI